jgi:hypothetical protein
MNVLPMLGTVLGLGFSSGLNLYATVLATGLAIRFHWLALPPALAPLQVLSDPVILAVAGVLYLVEFVADKVPVVDHVWDAVHTVVRPLGAALIAWAALGYLDSRAAVILVLLAGGVSLTSHAGKAGARAIINASGGPLVGLNLGVSVAEDVFAFVLAPLSVVHPIVMLVVVLIGVVAIAGLLAWALRGARRLARGRANRTIP